MIRMDKINKSNDGRTIDISDEKNSIFLKLNPDKTLVNISINNISIGEFKMENGKLNIYNKVLKCYGNQISSDLLREKKYLGNWEGLREDALREIGDKFIGWNRSQNRIDFSGSIAVGLTFGYSAVLKIILKRIIDDNIQNIRGLHIILIRSSEAPGDEEILKAELLADYGFQGLKCHILPIEAIEKKEIQFKIKSIFVGIESINKRGDIVHPRGGSEVIRKIQELNKDIGEYIKVYAFGESYKVQDFKDNIDFTKLSLFLHDNVDFVVTDHGVHEKISDKWKVGTQIETNLCCCSTHWINILRNNGYII